MPSRERPLKAVNKSGTLTIFGKGGEKGGKKKSWHLSRFDNFSGFVAFESLKYFFVAFQSFMIIWVAFQTFAENILTANDWNATVCFGNDKTATVLVHFS